MFVKFNCNGAWLLDLLLLLSFWWFVVIVDKPLDEDEDWSMINGGILLRLTSFTLLRWTIGLMMVEEMDEEVRLLTRLMSGPFDGIGTTTLEVLSGGVVKLMERFRDELLLKYLRPLNGVTISPIRWECRSHISWNSNFRILSSIHDSLVTIVIECGLFVRTVSPKLVPAPRVHSVETSCKITLRLFCWKKEEYIGIEKKISQEILEETEFRRNIKSGGINSRSTCSIFHENLRRMINKLIKNIDRIWDHLIVLENWNLAWRVWIDFLLFYRANDRSFLCSKFIE